jgi:hypothetical protein
MSDIDSEDLLPSKYDVFMSYAHDDDNKLMDETFGWVEQFERDFRVTLKEQLGRPPEIWRDSDITPNDDFEKKIFRRLSQSLIFLPVLSKIFINRPYCLRELRTFAETAEKQLATYIGADGEKKRIFIVEKLPVDLERLPKELQGLGGKFKFHDSEQTLRPALSSRNSGFRDLYYTALNRLSKTAADLIRLAEINAASGVEPPAGLTVYLAQTTSDLEEQREVLRDELIDRGFRVLPDLELPHNVKRYTDAVKGYLESAVISVHVVGPEYGFIPEGEKELSNVRLQHQLALERSERGPPMPQVIWLADGGKSATDDRQKGFIEYLLNDERVHAHADLIEGDIESLKTDLLEKLARLQTASAAAEPEAPAVAIEHPRVYIICDPADRTNEHLKALRACLHENGCEVRLPMEGGAPDDARRGHEQKLKTFDAFVVFVGAAGPYWLEERLDEFHEFLRNRGQAVLAKTVYFAPPKSIDKDEFETHEATMIRADDKFDAAKIAPFLKSCGRSPAGPT